MADQPQTSGDQVTGRESEATPSLGVGTEPRRGDICVGVLGVKPDGEEWPGTAFLPVAEARAFAWAILRACRAAEDAERYAWTDGHVTMHEALADA